MAYTLSSGGSDWVNIKVLTINQESGDATDLDDKLEFVKFSSLAWTHDHKVGCHHHEMLLMCGCIAPTCIILHLCLAKPRFCIRLLTPCELLVPCQLLLCNDRYKSFATDTGFTAASQHGIAKFILCSYKTATCWFIMECTTNDMLPKIQRQVAMHLNSWKHLLQYD